MAKIKGTMPQVRRETMSGRVGGSISLPNPTFRALGLELKLKRTTGGRMPRKKKKQLKKIAWYLPASEALSVLLEYTDFFDDIT